MFWIHRVGKKLIAVALTIGLGISAAGSSYPSGALQIQKSNRTSQFDLVVYGGSPGGVMAGIAAARRGLRREQFGAYRPALFDAGE